MWLTTSPLSFPPKKFLWLNIFQNPDFPYFKKVIENINYVLYNISDGAYGNMQ